MPILDVQDLVVDYRSGADRAAGRGGPAVDGVTFTIAPGSTLGLVGESGCGKTTTARAVMGLVPVTSGDVVVAGRKRTPKDRDFRRQVQMVFQDPFSSLNPRRRVGAILGETLAIFGAPRGEREHRVSEILERVGLSPEHAQRYPGDFSGGQRQRIGLARALIVEPELIVCDEPVSALDVSVQAQVLNLMRDLQRDLGLSYLFITHDLSVVRYMADRVAVMKNGKVVEEQTTDDLFANPYQAYTRDLLAAVPRTPPAPVR